MTGLTLIAFNLRAGLYPIDSPLHMATLKYFRHVTKDPVDEAREPFYEHPYAVTYAKPNLATIIQEQALKVSGRLGIIVGGPQGMPIKHERRLQWC